MKGLAALIFVLCQGKGLVYTLDQDRVGGSEGRDLSVYAWVDACADWSLCKRLGNVNSGRVLRAANGSAML